MGEAIITRRSSGAGANTDANIFAYIIVTYPEGSTCTCTDGATTLTAETTSGSYTFKVPHAATWTVASTKGNLSESKSVSIGTSGDSVEVTLSYRLYLIKDGIAQVTWSEGGEGVDIYTNSGFLNVRSEYRFTSAPGYYYTDLSAYANLGYTTIKIDAESHHGSGDISSILGTFLIGSSYSSAASSVRLSSVRSTKAIDISSLSLSTYKYLSLKTSNSVDATSSGNGYQVNENYLYNVYLTI